MRILFASTPGAGHVGPLLPLAAAAGAAGHTVTVATVPKSARHVHRAELPWHALDPAAPEDLAQTERRLATLSGEQRIVAAVTDLFGRCHSGAALEGMVRHVEEHRPDVIVAEPCELSSRIAAARYGIPFVMASIGLGSGLERRLGDVLAGVLAELGERVGVDAPTDTVTPIITRAPRALEGPDAPPDPPELLRVRHLAAPRDATEPLVYVSFGSEIPTRPEGWFPRVYTGVARALADVDAQVLIAVGDQRDPADLGPLPANARAEQWVAQADVLSRAAVMVGHGGAGSTLDALTAGVPMALVPLFADQPLNARMVEAAGAGLTFTEDELDELGAAVATMLTEPAFRDAARAVAAEIAGLPPLEAAVELLERAAPVG